MENEGTLVAHRGDNLSWRTTDGACHSATTDDSVELDEFMTALRDDPHFFERMSQDERYRVRERVAAYDRNHPIRSVADLNRRNELRSLAARATRDEDSVDAPITTLAGINKAHRHCFAARRSA
jgi:hypothetical protein